MVQLVELRHQTNSDHPPHPGIDDGHLQRQHRLNYLQETLISLKTMISPNVPRFDRDVLQISSRGVSVKTQP